jgi:hypothetical protein
MHRETVKKYKGTRVEKEDWGIQELRDYGIGGMGIDARRWTLWGQRRANAAQ